MPYWDIVGRSFIIAWRHKYLWLLGLFAGEGGGGSFSYNQGTRQTGNTTNAGHAAQQFATWLSQHWSVIVATAIVWLILIVALFILAAVCEGALIRGAAEHDAERPFGLGSAWRTGVHTMWLIVRLRLLLVALGLPAVVVVVGVITGGVIAAFSNNGGLAAILIGLGVLLGLALVVYLIYLSFLDRLGARTAILEVQPAIESLRRAHRLLFRRLGRALLVWLLSIAVAFAVGIASAIVLLVAAAPLIAGIFATINGSSAAWPLIVIGSLFLLIVALPVIGFTSAQMSTYWTLAFRRMDVEYPPSYPYQPPQAAQP